MQSNYVCPLTRKPLLEAEGGLAREDGVIYPYVATKTTLRIPNFLDAHQHGQSAKESLAEYDTKASAEIYRNSLNWLFSTFGEDQASFRRAMISRLRLRPGSRVLITGCGLGDDIVPMLEAVGAGGEVYANDLAAAMAMAAADTVAAAGASNAHLAVCDAQRLPFPDGFFDGAYHFGGINVFDDIRAAIGEMNRVVRPGGRVVVGDEGVAPWLKTTEYGRIAINNNSLWGSDAPIALLPPEAMDVQLTWVLGNCFYVIDFEVSQSAPRMDVDVPHKGPRGGSMRTRYFGRLEGVSAETKKFVYEEAARRRMSVHDWLETVLRAAKEQTNE